MHTAAVACELGAYCLLGGVYYFYRQFKNKELDNDSNEARTLIVRAYQVHSLCTTHCLIKIGKDVGASEGIKQTYISSYPLFVYIHHIIFVTDLEF